MTYKQSAQAALDVQDASNLSGVARSFGDAVTAVFAESQRLNKGTNWRNTHPVITLFLLKMAELNGCGSSLDISYEPAEKRCREIARDSVSADDLAVELRQPMEKDPTCALCDSGEPHEH